MSTEYHIQVEVPIELQVIESQNTGPIPEVEVEAPIELQATQNGLAVGPRGYSAYEIAVREGFVGTEDEWFDSLANRIYRFIEVRVKESVTDLREETEVGGDFRIPRAVTLRAVGAYVDTAGVGGVTTVDLKENGVSVLSTKITIDSEEKSSEDATISPVISTSSITPDAVLNVDIIGVSIVPPKGLTVWMEVVM